MTNLPKLCVLVALLMGCAQPPQKTPPIGGTPADSAQTVALRERAMFTAEAEAELHGWRIARIGDSPDGQWGFAHVGAWYKAEPFWTIGLPIIQPDPNAHDGCLEWDQVVTINGKTHTIHRRYCPRATVCYQFMDAEGPNQARRYNVILVVRPEDIWFAKYHHGTDTLELHAVDMVWR